MSEIEQNPYRALERLFHEPNRLGIMSVLSSGAEGKAFNELRDELELTDGNLSRHLKALEKAGAVRIEKNFVKSKPRTTILVTDQGREDFLTYLRTLELALKKAAASVSREAESESRGFGLEGAAEA